MIDRLEAHYLERKRDEAIGSLTTALGRAYDRIEAGPLAVTTYPAPRPYPSLTGFGWKWILEDGCWGAFIPGVPDQMITAVFHVRGDGPELVAGSR